MSSRSSRLPLLTRRLPLASLGAVLGVALLVLSNVAGAAGAGAVGLGTAKTYGVLAGAGVTNTGSTVIQRDLGTCPTAAITGFPPGVVNGTTHAADAAACGAKSDLTIAYNDAAGRAPTTTYGGPTDLAGLTLVPGVYRSPTSFSNTGTLSLNAQGDPNAVFIFQAGSTVITAPNSHVALVNGARACNVFWQVGSSATLGVGSTFVGTILALTSITANTNAVINGRLLARNGAVTLDSNRVSTTLCAAPTTTTSSSTTSSTTVGGPTTTSTTVGGPTTTTTSTTSTSTTSTTAVRPTTTTTATTVVPPTTTTRGGGTGGGGTGGGGGGSGGGGGGSTTTFTVVAPTTVTSPPTTTPPAPTPVKLVPASQGGVVAGLPVTGSAVGWHALAGTLALALGAVLMFLAGPNSPLERRGLHF